LDTTVWVHTHPHAIAGKKERGEEKKKARNGKKGEKKDKRINRQ
jgi:hypothetical protein